MLNFIRKLFRSKGADNSCGGDGAYIWYVVSTALSTVSLELQCKGCGAFAMVRDPSKEEWSDAFNAPSSPYPWTMPDRVTDIFSPLDEVMRGMAAERGKDDA